MTTSPLVSCESFCQLKSVQVWNFSVFLTLDDDDGDQGGFAKYSKVLFRNISFSCSRPSTCRIHQISQCAQNRFIGFWLLMVLNEHLWPLTLKALDDLLHVYSDKQFHARDLLHIRKPIIWISSAIAIVPRFRFLNPSLNVPHKLYLGDRVD